MPTDHPHETVAADRVVSRLLDLWAAPIEDPDEAMAAFAAVYTDPVMFNGVALPLATLVGRAADMHRALQRTGVEILEVVTCGDKVVVAFEMTARHIGVWSSVLGGVPATGRTVTSRTIDILTVTGGLITGIWVVSDEVGLLSGMGASIRP